MVKIKLGSYMPQKGNFLQFFSTCKFRSAKGSVFAEAILAIPLLLGITCFIFELGNVLYISNTLNQISREAARYVSVTPTFTTTELLDSTGANDLVPDSTKLTITIDPPIGSARTVGTTLTINVEYKYIPIINPFKLFNSSNEWAPRLRSRTVARSEVSNA